MPPYNPPSTHYCEMNAFPNASDNFKLIGPKGHNFKRLTVLLRVEYMWWNMERNVIEIWGPYAKMNSSQKYLSKYMTKFYKKHCENQNTDLSPPSKRLKVTHN